jgi:hypothetical protein
VLDAADALLSSEGAEAVTIRGNDLLLALVDRLAGRLEYPPLPALPRERLVRAGISQQGPSVEQSLRGAPDPERYPTLAS